jgi:tRNA(Ile)-lysidine synthase TilS/MesJ
MAPITSLVSKKIGKALGKYQMLEDGDTLLVAVSGGKDSLILLHYLVEKQKSLPVDYAIEAVHVNTDISPHRNWADYREAVASMGVELDSIDVSLTSRLAPGKSMNCYWCATQRRMELLQYAGARGISKIALGHHMDDILETLLMNMMYRAELSTMLPVFTYDNYSCTIIRPLSLVKETEIISAVDELGFGGITSVCNCGELSKRKEIRKSLDYLCREGDYIKDAIFKAMENVKARYLP